MTEQNDRQEAVHGIVGAVRQIVSPDGMLWRVAEVVGPSYDRRGRSLVFSNEEVMRRVRNYPPNWRELTDAELFAISLRI